MSNWISVPRTQKKNKTAPKPVVQWWEQFTHDYYDYTCPDCGYEENSLDSSYGQGDNFFCWCVKCKTKFKPVRRKKEKLTLKRQTTGDLDGFKPDVLRDDIDVLDVTKQVVGGRGKK